MTFLRSATCRMPSTVLSLPLLVLAAFLACAAAGEPKGIGVSLRVKWPGTSTLLEAAEYLAAESPSAFWSFVEAWQSPKDTQTSCWDAILSSAGQHVSSEMALSLQQAMASRQYTAKVEMLRNLAESTEVPDSCIPHRLATLHVPQCTCMCMTCNQFFTTAKPTGQEGWGEDATTAVACMHLHHVLLALHALVPLCCSKILPLRPLDRRRYAATAELAGQTSCKTKYCCKADVNM